MPRLIGSGCITCRIRRVKCDEEKPHCRRCLATGRKCDGYLPATSRLSRRDLANLAQQTSLGDQLRVSRSPSQAPASLSSIVGGEVQSSPQSRECQLFDLFRSVTAPASAILVPSQFWTGDILQLAHVEPAIWHAVVALGGLNYSWHSETATTIPPPAAGEAEAHYHHAVSLARSMSHPEQALALSLALGAAANLMGNLREGRMHVAAGRKLLCELGHTDEVAHAAEVVARLDLEAMSFGEVTAPYEPQDSALLRHVGLANYTIGSYEQATSSLFRLMRMLMMVGEGVPTIPNNLATDWSFGKEMLAWEAAMDRYENQLELSRVDEGRDTVPALSIRLYHCLLRTFVVFATPGPETRFDAYLGLFSRLLFLAKALHRVLHSSIRIMTMEQGLVMALFLVGSKCRHRDIRWQCVRLLDSLNRQEGLWRSDAIAASLRRVIEVEEEEMNLQVGGRPSSKSPPGSISSMGDSSRTSSNDGVGETHDLHEEFYEDRLRMVMAVPWTAWAEPHFVPPTWETWDAVPVIPEICRVKSFLPRMSIKERSMAATMFMSPGETGPEDTQSFSRVREETCWF